MKQVHTLKLNPKYWCALAIRLKTFEIRLNDRDFQVNDVLILTPIGLEHLPASRLTFRITYISKFQGGLKPGYVVLGIKTIKDTK